MWTHSCKQICQILSLPRFFTISGRDCMDNVCQRLGLQQPDLFGLRYVSRRSYPKIRWADLDRPLKKQLDKYAQEPYLYLAVM